MSNLLLIPTKQKLNTRITMFKNITKLLITLLTTTHLFGCEDEKTDKVSESVVIEQQDASIDASQPEGEAPSPDAESDIPVQMMEFDTMEIEPDPDLGPDMDD